ncbi:N-acetylmuramoyl-L-alanine amidase [Verrucomicrobiaceae bacterium R5-34]|nr:N-acetylmuramoyl-L-alanine amidase [Verrucomicrobiaceae bacterium R5-34]
MDFGSDVENRFWPQKWPMVAMLGIIWSLAACSSSPDYTSGDRSAAGSDYAATASSGHGLAASAPRKSSSSLYREVNVKKSFIPKGKHARKYRRRLNPKYITIHSTQNYSSSADAWRHSLALNNGKLRASKRKGGNRIGYLTWHYTVDQYRAVQHLPCNEQGEHADFDGPGNNYSLAIEMCENRGNSRAATIERTAKLSAWLMKEYDIPLRNVVPHYHWERKGLSKPHKNCPHFLLDNGRPGAKWQWFLAKVNKYYKSITSGSPTLVSTTPVNTRPIPVITQAQPRVVQSTPRPTVRKTTTTRSKPKPKVRYHTVRRGDTLYSLSRKYGTSVTAIQKANGMKSTLLINGKRLRIP